MFIKLGPTLINSSLVNSSSLRNKEVIAWAHHRQIISVQPIEVDCQKKNVLIECLGHSEDGRDDVDGRVALVPKSLELFQRNHDISLVTRLEHSLNDKRMRLIAHFEDILSRDDAESGVGRLKVV